jgi:O-antigen/teichoic acid export membrane protein
MLVIAAPLVLPFFWLWLGPQIGKDASPVAYGLMPGVWANSLALVVATSLTARGNTRFLALVHLAEIIPFLLLLYAAIHFLGLVGASLAWSVRCVIDAAIIFGGQRVPIMKTPVALSGTGILSVAIILLVFPANDGVRWILLVAVGGATLWQAWTWRPSIARTCEDRFYAALRKLWLSPP